MVGSRNEYNEIDENRPHLIIINKEVSYDRFSIVLRHYHLRVFLFYGINPSVQFLIRQTFHLTLDHSRPRGVDEGILNFTVDERIKSCYMKEIYIKILSTNKEIID